jgi:hypothetical protein
MTIIEALVRLRNDMRTWVANNLHRIAVTDVSSTLGTSDKSGYVATYVTFYKGEDKEVLQTVKIYSSLPKLKIEDNKWYASYDNGTTWEYLYEVGANYIVEISESDYENLDSYDDNTIYVVN